MSLFLENCLWHCLSFMKNGGVRVIGTSESPVPDEIIRCCHQIVLHVDASQVIQNLRGRNLLIWGVDVVPVADLQDTQTNMISGSDT